ncbi:MAG: CDP-diacylglycerol--glycerol-3-phosphate 3-phosphatidyltransferase [Myxococcota bacterium]
MRPLRIPRERFWNAPNAITLGRIGASFLLLLLPLFDGLTGSRIIGFGFLAVSLTDLLDGYLARRDGTVTRIGKLLDPLADKVLVMTALVMLVATPGRIPLWAVPMVVLILAREMAVTGLRAMASSEGVVLHASSLGKWKTGFQTASLTCLLLHYPWLGLPLHALGLWLLLLATGLTLWSGYDYFAAYLGRGEGPGADAP